MPWWRKKKEIKVRIAEKDEELRKVASTWHERLQKKIEIQARRVKFIEVGVREIKGVN